MHIIHIVGGDLRKGAHRGAYWLHQGLESIGVRSTILGPVPESQERPGIVSLSTRWIDRRLDEFIGRADRLLVRAYPSRANQSFSAGLVGKRVWRHPLIAEADIVNLHWVSKGPISVHGIRTLAKLGKPIVWTLRDMWPFTGGCHLAMDCSKYTERCGACPQLGSRRQKDLSNLVWRNKQKHYPRDVTVIGISEWLSECARQSSLFSGTDVRTIPNCVDTDIFRPIQKDRARDELGITSVKKIVLLGAGLVTSYFKGFEHFLGAAHALDSDNLLVVTFGNVDPAALSKIPQESLHLGYLNDDAALRLAYSAADVFVAPTLQEAFGKTLVEAMSCGTPVVCFDCTGPKDIVVHRKTGYKAALGSSEDLANGIRWVLGHDAPEELRSLNNRRAVTNYDKKNIARKYANLYQELIRDSHD